MLYVPFRLVDTLKKTCESFAEAYAIFLQADNVPQSLEEDIRRLREQQEEDNDKDDEEELDITTRQPRATEEWMLICRCNADFTPTHVVMMTTTGQPLLPPTPT